MTQEYSSNVTFEALAALEDALFRGVYSVTYDGKTVTYRSLADMKRLRDLMKAELGITGAKSKRSKRFKRGVLL